MERLRALLSGPWPSGLGLISGGLLLIAAYAADVDTARSLYEQAAFVTY